MYEELEWKLQFGMSVVDFTNMCMSCSLLGQGRQSAFLQGRFFKEANVALRVHRQ
jgi:hypothetical protein